MSLCLLAACSASVSTPYHTYPEDEAHYTKQLLPFLPTGAASDDLSLFLPVSYHMNPANYEALERSTKCSADELTWYGPVPSYHYCGYYGRGCYSSDAGCAQRCDADLLQAFGNHSGHGGDVSALKVSAYFTWYSRKYNQPVLSGFWSSAYASADPSARLCEQVDGLCDATCADSGPTAASLRAGAFEGCAGLRACGRFASCALGSTTVPQSWAHEEPAASDQATCKAGGFLWQPAQCYGHPSIDDPSACHAAHGTWYPSRCTWQPSPDCKTGRCFDRGHVVPSGGMGQLFGRSGQSFSMCNIAAQTATLNECKWMYLEQAVACAGRHYKVLTLAGSLGPYKPSGRMGDVPWPAFQWKLSFVPKQAGVAADAVLVWLMPNDEDGAYDPASYAGRAGLEQIEKGLGLAFPDAIRSASFANSSSALLLSLLGDDKQAACGIRKSTWTRGDASPTHAQLAAWGPWNVLHGDDASAAPLPTFPCPSPQSDLRERDE